AGQPVRPGQAPDGGVLLPLEKSRAGDEAPVFAVELFYLVRDTAWTEKGKARLILPALDLPVSRTGLLLYHSPQFRVTAEPGTFRTEPYENPFSAALNPSGFVSTAFSTDGRNSGDVTKALNKLGDFKASLDDYHNKAAGGRGVRILPVRVSFPSFGM